MKTGPQLRNPLTEILAQGHLGLALIVQKSATVDIALAARRCGFDALYVDLEHGVIPEAAAAQVCIAALLAGVTPLVRLPNHAPDVVGRMLDAGALGVIAPHVSTAEEARAIASACRFSPAGNRSVSYHWPHLFYDTSYEATAVHAAFNAAATVIVMLESPQAIEQADSIAAVPGVDILHVGSIDLADSLGIPSDLENPRMLVCYDQVIDACRRHGKVAGIGGAGGRPAVAKYAYAKGARFLTAGIDWDLLLQAASQRVQSLRQLEEK